MKFVIKIIDWGEALILHAIDVFAVYGNEFQPKQWILLEQYPYIEDRKVFKTAVNLACKLRSAGFDVEMTREQIASQQGVIK